MASLAVTEDIDIGNPELGDLALTPGGQFFMRGPTFTDLRDEVDQRLRVRFQFFSGEWFLNLNAGVPYYQHILVKAPSDQTIRSVFGQVIRRTEGVQELLDFTYTLEPRTRRLSIRFEAKLEDGATYRSYDYAPFVIAA